MNIDNNKKMDYQFIQGLFDLGFNYGEGWKSHYFREAQSCFEKHFTPLNKWRQNPNDSTTEQFSKTPKSKRSDFGRLLYTYFYL